MSTFMTLAQRVQRLPPHERAALVAAVAMSLTTIPKDVREEMAAGIVDAPASVDRLVASLLTLSVETRAEIVFALVASIEGALINEERWQALARRHMKGGGSVARIEPSPRTSKR